MEQPDVQASNFWEVERELIFSVASRNDFGFTVGASQVLIRCIHDTTRLASLQVHEDVETRQSATEELYQRILECDLEHSSSQELVQLHHEIFKMGVLIHFHRRILNSVPCALIPLLDILLGYVTKYESLKGGYITIWPVFIAAVEAYKEDHKSCLRGWLNSAEKLGAANRVDAGLLIEAVWRERKRKTNEIGEGTEEGDVIVDWRQVMEEMRMHILLV